MAMRKPNDNWKLLNIFSDQWSEQYGGAIYPRSGRDLAATKDFLMLYPDVFADEALRLELALWIKNFLNDNFWHKPTSNPPLRHEFFYFVKHMSKYTEAQKKIEYVPKSAKVVSSGPKIHCSNCRTVHGINEACKLEEVK